MAPRTVTITVPTPTPGAVIHATFEWEPDMPRRLSKRGLRHYRTGHDAVFAEPAERSGLRTVLVEV